MPVTALRAASDLVLAGLRGFGSAHPRQAARGPERHARYAALRAADPAVEWVPFWGYGAYIDARDVAFAVLAALRHPDPGHLTALIAAEDSTSPVPPRELARKLLPDVPWRGPEPSDPRQALVRCHRARAALNWASRYRWEDRGIDER